MPPPNEISTKDKPVKDDAAAVGEHADADAHKSFFKELAVSAAYSVIEQPTLGVSQIAGNDAMNKVKKTFSAFGIEAPKTDHVTTSIWYAQTIGGALGMVVPYALTKFGLSKLGAVGRVAAEERSLLSPRAALALDVKESAITGMTYGTLFTPSDEKKRNAGVTSFLLDRGVSGIGTAATFSTLAAGSFGIDKLAKTEISERLRVAPILGNKFVSGMVSGLPSGLVSSEYDSLTKKHEFASGSDVRKAMLSMSVVGGSFGAFSIISRGNSLPTEKTKSAVDQQEQHETLTSGDLKTPKLAVEPPTVINPNEFKPAHTSDQSARVELTTDEKALWNHIRIARTPEQWQSITAHIDEHVPLDRAGWFNETLQRQSKNMSDGELNTLWPELLQTNAHQGYSVARILGTERTTRLWQQQLDSLPENGNPPLANELTKTLVYVDPNQQLPLLHRLLSRSEPPGYVDMTPVTLAPEHQLKAAQMLVESGIKPQIETSAVSASAWADWALDLQQGKMRDSILEQIRRKIVGSNKNAAAELNSVYKIAESKGKDTDYSTLNGMLTGINPKQGDFGGKAIRETALRGIDAKFIGRMTFAEGDWAKGDKLAEQNPELVRALAINSKFSPSLTRSNYISSLMTTEPPPTVEDLSNSIVEQARQGAEGKRFLLSPGDIKALVEHGPIAAPDAVPSLMNRLRSEVLESFDLQGNKPVSRERLISLLTLAHGLGKANPKSFDSDFREPIESALANSSLPYPRRLEGARALGELQRAGFDSAAGIQLPELRMGKLVDLAPQDQATLRKSVEASLYSREAIQSQLGDGPLGRLMPSIFGRASEGGIVGRSQHTTHDSSLDIHVLDVVDKTAKDPEFARLLPKDQVNVLWASLLHDVGKRENMVDLDHNWTSTGITWGILRTLGYPDSRIQRITDIMSKDADLSFDPDHKNSVRLSNPTELDNVVNSYRHADALNMVAILNRADIKSVKAGEAWWTPAVQDELSTIQGMARDRVAELNKHLLPILPSELPQGFGAYQLSDYTVLGHASYDLTGQLLRQRSTVESPEYSMSVSLLTPESRNLYSEDAQQLALVTGPFEHIAQANRTNLSTGTSVGWARHVQLVENWSQDYRAKGLAQEAETRLAELGIPSARDVAAENFPRLTQLRRVLGQFDNSTELRNMAGLADPYVQASNAINRILTTEKDGSPLKRNNEIKLNNPIISGIGLLRRGNQSIFFEGVSNNDLQTLWHGHVPDFVHAGPAGTAPPGSLTVSPELFASAKKNNLPIVILNDGSK